jgi:hypothetical protein
MNQVACRILSINGQGMRAKRVGWILFRKKKNPALPTEINWESLKNPAVRTALMV